MPNHDIVCVGVLWFTAEGTGQTPQNTSKIALIDTQPALWARLTLLATIMKNGLGTSILRVSYIPLTQFRMAVRTSVTVLSHAES